MSELRNRIERLKGQRDQLNTRADDLQQELTDIRKSINRHQQARGIIREVGLKTQQQLQYHISDITSMALDAVFDDPYELVVEFVQRRNKTECDLLFKRDGHLVDPTSATGGGAVDVAALALRIVAWSMTVPRLRNTIILDEPLKFMDGQTDRQERASKMIKELSDRLGLQFIIITHEPVLAEYADKVFQVRMRKGKSIVT